MNWAGHQQLMGSPTYCFTDTRMVNSTSTVGVYCRFNRSTKSSSVRNLNSCIWNKALISRSMVLSLYWLKLPESTERFIVLFVPAHSGGVSELDKNCRYFTWLQQQHVCMYNCILQMCLRMYYIVSMLIIILYAVYFVFHCENSVLLCRFPCHFIPKRMLMS